MSHFICQTCGTQFAESEQPPVRSPICEDERQYVGWDGQQWTTHNALARSRHNEVRQLEPQLVGIGAQPSFAIGQRALLIHSPDRNVLWDCISLLDEATVAAVKVWGGIRALTIPSH
ncbi:MAG: hypothetical protein KF893_19525 [Caldilineaceae bacterium]|nr:hypothetical protein [Caldilineaceae bacterium]